MGFSSINDLETEIKTNSKTYSYYWHKVFPTNVGTLYQRWYDYGRGTGNPVNNLYAGTNLAWTPCDESTGNGTQIFGIPHGGNVSPDTKHIINCSLGSSTTAPASGKYVLVDLQGYWPGINLNISTLQSLTGTPGSNLRYANGAGCYLYLVCTTAQGATATPNTTISYTNQNGTTGRSIIKQTPVAAVISSLVNNSTSAGFDTCGGPFYPLSDGDTGVANVASIQFGAAMGAGVAALCLARPLLSTHLTTSSSSVEKNLVYHNPILPRVRDGACLNWLYWPNGLSTTSTITAGHLQFAWG